MSRPIAVSLIVLTLLAAVLLWLWHRHATVPAPRPPSPASRRAQSPTSTAGPPPTVPPFRLAGVAVGDPNSYAVIEDPQGVTALYRLGENIAGLGRLAGIEPQEVLIETDRGPLALRLQPAATPTTGPAPTSTARRVRRSSRTPPASADDTASISPP
jgi:Type II secretion system protein C